MALFSIFKKSIKIQDKSFGELSLTTFKDRSKNFFTGEGYFNEHHPKVGFIINAEETGPTEDHYLFYEKLQNTFNSLEKKIIPLIIDEFQNWKEDFEILDFNNEFNIDCITIPRQNTKPLIWEISFTTIHDKNHWVTIHFIDFSPDRVLVDG